MPVLPHGNCVVPENIHTPTAEGHWKFRGGGGSWGAKVLKEFISLNWNFQRGGGAQTKKKTLCGRSMDIFWKNTLWHVRAPT